MFSFPYIVPLASAIANAILTFLVVRHTPQTSLTRVFSFLTAALVIWNLNFVVLYSVPDKELALSLTRIIRTGSFLVPPAVLHLILAIRPNRQFLWSIVLTVDYAIGAVLALINALGFYVTDLRSFAWGFYSVGTPYYHVFSSVLVISFALALGVLAHDFTSTQDSRTRLQLKFWLLGASVALPLGLTNIFPSYGIPFYPLGNFGNAIWAAIVGYAVIRHRLMDIDIVLTKGLAYALVSVIVIAPAFGAAIFIQQRSFGQIHPDFSVSLLILLLIVGSVFPTFRTLAEARIEKSLFRQKYEYRVALMAFTRAIVRILDRDQLIAELKARLTECLRLDRLAIFIADDDSGVFTLRDYFGVPPDNSEIPAKHPLVGVSQGGQLSMLLHELEAHEDELDYRGAADLLTRNGWEACIPFFSGVRVIGFLGLGRKRNLEAFSASDLDLLETLGAEAAIALENARLYGELKKSQELIRRADRLSALGTLAAGIAHEVRNPLVSIQTFFQLAPERMHDKEFVESFLPIAAGETKRISHLINELLSFARSPAPSLDVVNLEQTCNGVLTLLEPEARKSRVRLIQRCSTDTPVIFADPDQIKQVLINLVLNAIQASPEGSTVTVLTREIGFQNHTFARIEVVDQGPGITAERLDDIFVPFYTTKPKGTGLGLPIAHQIVSEHGGRLNAERNPNGGMRFIVDLPTVSREEQVPADARISKIGA